MSQPPTQPEAPQEGQVEELLEGLPTATVPDDLTGPLPIVPAADVNRAEDAHWWRGFARVVRSSSPPTTLLGAHPSGDDDVSQRHARSVIDLALRAGEAMLATGAGAADCVAMVLRLMEAFGIRAAHVDITYTSISISIHRGLHEDPLSVMRSIRGRSPDYTRLEGVQRVVHDVVEEARAGGEPDVDRARRRLRRALAAPHPYRRWVGTLGSALMALGVVMLFGARPGMWAIAALSAALVDRVMRQCSAWGVAAFFTQALCAAVPALLGLGLQAAEQQGIDVPGVQSPELVIVSGIVVLLAGLSVFGAAQDALDGYYVTAGARGLEVMLMTAGIAVGVVSVIALARRLDIAMDGTAQVTLGGNPLVSTTGAMLVGLGFALSTYTGLRATAVSSLVAGLSWCVVELMLLVGVTGAAAVAVAAALAGALAYAAQQVMRVPEIAVATGAIVPLLPGLAVYRAITLILESNPALVGNAVIQLVSAVTTGVGLAAGLSIGGFLARRRFGLDRAAIRARRSRSRTGA